MQERISYVSSELHVPAKSVHCFSVARFANFKKWGIRTSYTFRCDCLPIKSVYCFFECVLLMYTFSSRVRNSKFQSPNKFPKYFPYIPGQIIIPKYFPNFQRQLTPWLYHARARKKFDLIFRKAISRWLPSMSRRDMYRYSWAYFKSQLLSSIKKSSTRMIKISQG